MDECKSNKPQAYMFFVHGGIGQQLIHALKYEGKEEIGEDLGHWLGAILKKMPWQIEGIVLVPLHPKKLQKRGYNQCEKFGKALSKALRCPLIDGALIRVRNTQTLTKKNREARWNALEDAFEVVKPQQIEGKHLLLVDDVVTTGTTLETCAKVLLETPGVRVSIAAMCCSIENLP